MAQLNITLNQQEILQLLSENSNEAFKTLLQEKKRAPLPRKTIRLITVKLLSTSPRFP